MTDEPPATQGINSALADLRRGEPIWLHDDRLCVAFLAVEFADSDAFARFARTSPPKLLLSAERARVLDLIAESERTGTVVLEFDGVSLEEAQVLANPLLRDFASVRPTHVRGPTVPAIAEAAMDLVKKAQLLPALLYRYAQPGEGPGIDVRAVEDYSPQGALELLSSGPIRTAFETPSTISVFREPVGGLQHIALELGTVAAGAAPLVRLHSECLTGDVLSSRQCDCGPQLEEAKRQIAREGGVLIYLREEGRKIGLVNKLRAYALQRRGLDTFDANLHIGFGEDERDYAVAAEMLRRLGVSEVRLLTNNPAKVAALEAAGIPVRERISLHAGHGPHNADYLRAKRERSGHVL